MVETDPCPVIELAVADWFEEDSAYRCNCGVRAHGSDYLRHLGGQHGILDPERAAVVTRREGPQGGEEPVDPEVYDPEA